MLNLKSSTPSLQRQHWLEGALVKLRQHFAGHGYNIPANVRVSIGWPHGSRSGKSIESIGQCWYAVASTDGHYEIFISPSQKESLNIVDILAHELCHVVAGQEAKHGPKFKQVATTIGLTGKMTATVAGEQIKILVERIINAQGEYPAGALNVMRKGGKQTTRLLKCQCEECGYTVRITRKWVDEVGEPYCGDLSHGQMICEGA